MPILTHRIAETAAAGSEPLTLDDMKAHLRVTHDGEDGLITALIATARAACEETTGMALITRSYSLFLDAWPAAERRGWWDGLRDGAHIADHTPALQLPRPPLVSVEDIRMTDADGNVTVFDESFYIVDAVSRPGRIVLKDGISPPVSARAANGIEIRYKAGFGETPQSVPPILRQGLRLLAARLFEHRGDSMESALQASGAASLFRSYTALRIA